MADKRPSESVEGLPDSPKVDMTDGGGANPQCSSAGSAPATRPGERLIDVYNRYFDCVVADTPERLNDVFRLRYQVYCIENGYEDPADNPGGMERDEFDAQSLHSLLVHRPSGDSAGAVRMILPRGEGGGLPVHQISIHPDIHDPKVLPPNSSAEISRFAVSREFRRRLADDQWGGYYDVRFGHDRRVIPNLTLGLMRAIVAFSRDNGITHWCATLEPALLRLLARLGIHFRPVGPLIDFHGRRQPCIAEANSLLARCRRERLDVWEVITQDGALWPSTGEGSPLAEGIPILA